MLNEQIKENKKLPARKSQAEVKKNELNEVHFKAKCNKCNTSIRCKRSYNQLVSWYKGENIKITCPKCNNVLSFNQNSCQKLLDNLSENKKKHFFSHLSNQTELSGEKQQKEKIGIEVSEKNETKMKKPWWVSFWFFMLLILCIRAAGIIGGIILAAIVSGLIIGLAYLWNYLFGKWIKIRI